MHVLYSAFGGGIFGIVNRISYLEICTLFLFAVINTKLSKPAWLSSIHLIYHLQSLYSF